MGSFISHDFPSQLVLWKYVKLLLCNPAKRQMCISQTGCMSWTSKITFQRVEVCYILKHVYFSFHSCFLSDVRGCMSWTMCWCPYQVTNLFECQLFHSSSSKMVSILQGSLPSFIPTNWQLCLSREDICRKNTAAYRSAPTVSLGGSTPGRTLTPTGRGRPSTINFKGSVLGF